MLTQKIKFALSVGIGCLLLLVNIPAALSAEPLTDYISDQSPKRTISMDFKNADLSNVLKIFSQQSGLNFISSTAVSDKTVNLYLDKVPVEEALERILSANNLTYELKPESNIFIVKEVTAPEKKLMSRIYKLKNASVSSSKLNSTLSQVEVTATEETDAEGAGGIADTIRALLTTDGSVIEDARTNSLIVTDIPSQFPMIEQAISMLDVRVPLILIEVEMLDVSKNSADLIGAKFGSTPVSFTGAKKRGVFPFDMENVKEDGVVVFDEDNPNYSVSTLSFEGLSFIIQFLRTQSDTRNLARPRILTLNNETAEISIKTNEAIGLAAETIASEGTSTSVAQAERVETGVFLKVTPQANMRTGEITMAVEPKVIEARTGGTFGDQTFKDPEERGVKSVMRVNNGETLVIGGLMRTNASDTRTKVPLLERIPILGSAFRHKDATVTERELLIFISPRILEEDRLDEQKISSAMDKALLLPNANMNSNFSSAHKPLSIWESSQNRKKPFNQRLINSDPSQTRQQSIDAALSAIEEKRF